MFGLFSFRKDSEFFRRIVEVIISEVMMMIGEIVLGSICCVMIWFVGRF